jgi:hypothetical protein
MDKRGTWQKFKRPWVWGSLAFLLAAVVFYEFEPLRYRDLTLEQPPVCGPEHSGAHHNSKFETAWESDRFVVRATEYPNCAEEFERASVHVVGDRVLLRIRYHSPTGESFACHCRKVTVVRLANLEKRDYRVVRISLLPWP